MPNLPATPELSPLKAHIVDLHTLVRADLAQLVLVEDRLDLLTAAKALIERARRGLPLYPGHQAHNPGQPPHNPQERTMRNTIQKTADYTIGADYPASASVAGRGIIGIYAKVASKGFDLTVYDFRGQRLIIARELGRALEYASDGKRLLGNLTGEWAGEFVEGTHYMTLRGKDLKEFKSRVPANGTRLKGINQLTLLTQAGVHLVLLKTDKPEGRELRELLARHGMTELVEREVAADPDVQMDTEPANTPHALPTFSEVVAIGQNNPQMADRLLRLLEARAKVEEAQEATRQAELKVAAEKAKADTEKERRRTLRLRTKAREQREAAAERKLQLAREKVEAEQRLQEDVVFYESIPEHLAVPPGYRIISGIARHLGYVHPSGKENTKPLREALKALGLYELAGVNRGLARVCLVPMRGTHTAGLTPRETFCYSPQAQAMVQDYLLNAAANKRGA